MISKHLPQLVRRTLGKPQSSLAKAALAPHVKSKWHSGCFAASGQSQFRRTFSGSTQTRTSVMSRMSPAQLADHGYYHTDLLRLLEQPTLVVQRKIEIFSLFTGFEVNNRYDVMDYQGRVVAYMEERRHGILSVLMRQVFRLHRPFHVDLMDLEGRKLLTIVRNFSWINSHIKVYAHFDQDEANPVLLGETVQQWHLWRRKYNLYHMPRSDGGVMEQFGYIDTPFLGFDFIVQDEQNRVVAMVERLWGWLGREFLTDVSTFVIRMDKYRSFHGVLDGPFSDKDLDIKQKATLLANAISIDFDYFSRHSRRGVGFFNIFSE